MDNELNLDEVLESLERRFESGNNQEVTQARISKEEYDCLMEYISDLQYIIQAVTKQVDINWT